jgi:hypothetical protein
MSRGSARLGTPGQVRLGKGVACAKARTWWLMPVIPAVKFKASLGYIVRPCFKRNKTKGYEFLCVFFIWK